MSRCKLTWKLGAVMLLRGRRMTTSQQQPTRNLAMNMLGSNRNNFNQRLQQKAWPGHRSEIFDTVDNLWKGLLAYVKL